MTPANTEQRTRPTEAAQALRPQLRRPGHRRCRLPRAIVFHDPLVQLHLRVIVAARHVHLLPQIPRLPIRVDLVVQPVDEDLQQTDPAGDALREVVSRSVWLSQPLCWGHSPRPAPLGGLP